MNNQRLIEALNHALAQELAALMQYFWHHVMAVGLASPALRIKWREMSLEEMRHAEELAERIDHFGGVPTTQPLEIKVGGPLEGMIQQDAALEEELVKMYRGYLDIVKDDPVTHSMLLQILADEESHLDEFQAWLGQ